MAIHAKVRRLPTLASTTTTSWLYKTRTPRGMGEWGEDAVRLPSPSPGQRRLRTSHFPSSIYYDTHPARTGQSPRPPAQSNTSNHLVLLYPTPLTPPPTQQHLRPLNYRPKTLTPPSPPPATTHLPSWLQTTQTTPSPRMTRNVLISCTQLRFSRLQKRRLAS